MQITKEQNLATLFTVFVFSLLLLFFYVYKLQLKNKILPIKNEFIEVNLGDVEESSGKEAVLKEGESGATQPTLASTQEKTPTESVPEQATPKQKAIEEIDGDESVKTEKKVPKKPIVKVLAPKKTIVKKPVQSNNNKNTQPLSTNKETSKQSIAPKTTLVQKIEAPPQPKAIFGPPKKEVGNNANQTNNNVNQGVAKAEMGDMGKVNGNPNSSNYSNDGNTSLNISSQLLDRGVVSMPKFEADFNQNAIIKIEIKVDEYGNASFIRVLKTNTPNPLFLKIIRQKMQSLKFRTKDEESFGSIEFHFKVNE